MRTTVSPRAAIEESFFLGLRLNRGVDLDRLRAEFTAGAIAPFEPAIAECERDGLLESDLLEDGLREKEGTTVHLTARGRLLSNEVFARFLGEEIDAKGQEVKVGTGHVNPR